MNFLEPDEVMVVWFLCYLPFSASPFLASFFEYCQENGDDSDDAIRSDSLPKIKSVVSDDRDGGEMIFSNFCVPPTSE